MFKVRPKETHSVVMADGVRLDADVYWPVGDGPFPVLLMRQPYGRAIASTIVYANPRWYAAHGYIVVIQDVRGRGSSAGAFELFAHEVADGAETIRWAAELPRSDGQVGMYGFSYQGMTQLYAAQSGCPELKTIAPAMTGYHLYEDWAYENGALCFQLGLVWALQLAAETARIQGDVTCYQQLLAAAHHLPLREAILVCPEVLRDVDSFFHDWVRRSPEDSYWQSLTPQLAQVDLPMLHIGGWFDPYLRGDVRLYKEMAARSAYPHHFWVGPWQHIPWGRKVGEMDFGAAAMSPVDSLQVQWFDHVLKGIPLPAANAPVAPAERSANEGERYAAWSPEDDRQPTGDAGELLNEQRPVCLFEMGRNQWRRFQTWPQAIADSTTFLLQSDGLANIRLDSGQLIPCENRGAPLDEGQKTGMDVLVHDPWNPAPSLGGHAAIPAGVFDRTWVDSRGDVLTYTSLPMKAELRVAGQVTVSCSVGASHASYDLCAVLSRVTVAGKAYNLTQGYVRCDDPDRERVLKLHPTCFSLDIGECLRLSLSAACFPAYAMNVGTGKPLAESRLIDAQVITLSVATGGASTLSIPVIVSSKG